MTVSEIKSEWIWHDSSGSNIRKKWHRTNRYDALRYTSTCYTFTNGSAAFDTLQERIPHITVYYICRDTLITFVTVLNLITPQWAFESEFIREQSHFIAIVHEWPLVTTNLNVVDMTLPAIILEKNDTGLTGTLHYDIFRSITRFQTVLLHSINSKHQFRILQYITLFYRS